MNIKQRMSTKKMFYLFGQVSNIFKFFEKVSAYNLKVKDKSEYYQIKGYLLYFDQNF